MTREDVERILRCVTRWAGKREDVSGLALCGSWARGAATPESDLDLIVIADRPDRLRADPGWHGEIDWESAGYSQLNWTDWVYGAVWSRHVGLLPAAAVELTICGRHWADADPVDPGTRRVVGGGFRILLDPAGRLARLVVDR